MSGGVSQDTDPPPRRSRCERLKPAVVAGEAAFHVVRGGGRRRHERAMPGLHAARRRGRREISQVEPERGAERVEGGHLAARQGARESVSERGAGAQPGRRQGGAATVHPAAVHRHVQHPHRPGGGAQIHCAVAVYRPVGVSAVIVGGGEQPRDQFGVGELVAEQLLHHRQPAGHERCGDGSSLDVGVSP